MSISPLDFQKFSIRSFDRYLVVDFLEFYPHPPHPTPCFVVDFLEFYSLPLFCCEKRHCFIGNLSLKKTNRRTQWKNPNCLGIKLIQKIVWEKNDIIPINGGVFLKFVLDIYIYIYIYIYKRGIALKACEAAMH